MRAGLVNTLRWRQNGRHFADDTFKRIFLNENVRIAIKISLTFVPRGPINNIPSLVQIMAWHRPGEKPLSEPMMARLPTHICVTRPQWVNLPSDLKWNVLIFLKSTAHPKRYSVNVVWSPCMICKHLARSLKFKSYLHLDLLIIFLISNTEILLILRFLIWFQKL